jgi:hypothetical protein
MTSSVTDTTVTPRTFSFTQEQLSHIQNFSDQGVQTLNNLPAYSDQGVQTLNNLTNRVVVMGPRTTLREVITDQNIRMTHLERRFSSSEVRDSIISTNDQGVQTDPQLMMDVINNSSQYFDYIDRAQQLADFTGL